MRCVFTTTMSVDIDAADDQLRAAFIEFVTMKAREMYGPAAMLAKTTPEFALTLTSSRAGKEQLPVFEGEVNEEDDD